MLRPNMARPPGQPQFPPGVPRPGMPPPLRRVDSRGGMFPPSNNQNPNVPFRPMPPQNRPPWPMNRPPFPPNFQGRPPGPPGLINRGPGSLIRPPPPFRPSQPQVRPPPPLRSSSSSSLGSGEQITARPQQPQPPTIKKDDDDVVFGSDTQISPNNNLTSFESIRKTSNLFGEAVEEDSNFDNFRKLDLQTSKFLWVCQLFHCTAIKTFLFLLLLRE